MTPTTGRIPWILFRNTLVGLALLGLAVWFYSRPEPNKEAAALCVTNALALLMHSGRSRQKLGQGGGAAGFLLPLACAAQLTYGCNGGDLRWAGWRESGHEQLGRCLQEVARAVPDRLEVLDTAVRACVDGAFGPQFAASHIALIPQASSPIPSSTAGLYAKSSDNLPRLVGTDATEYIAGTAWRLRQSAGAPGGVTEGDLWYDSAAHTFLYRDNSGNVTLANAGSYVTVSGSQTISGAKTFSAAPVFAAGATASGSTDFDLTGSTGKLLTNEIDLATTKVLKAGANTLIGCVSDKLCAAMLAIASQATGDILVADSSSTFARLAKGSSDGMVLSMVSGAVAWATRPFAQVAGGGTGALGAATVYLTAAGQAASASEIYLALVTRATTSRNLYCRLGVAPGGADTVDVTVRENGSDQTLTCQIAAAATTCNDTTHTFTSVAGDRLSVKAVSSAGTAADVTCTFEET